MFTNSCVCRNLSLMEIRELSDGVFANMSSLQTL